MVNGVFQVQDSIFDGIADVILWIRSGGGDLFIGTAFCKLLVLQERWKWIISNAAGKQKCLKQINAGAFWPWWGSSSWAGLVMAAHLLQYPLVSSATCLQIPSWSMWPCSSAERCCSGPQWTKWPDSYGEQEIYFTCVFLAVRFSFWVLLKFCPEQAGLPLPRSEY